MDESGTKVLRMVLSRDVYTAGGSLEASSSQSHCGVVCLTPVQESLSRADSEWLKCVLAHGVGRWLFPSLSLGGRRCDQEPRLEGALAGACTLFLFGFQGCNTHVSLEWCFGV